MLLDINEYFYLLLEVEYDTVSSIYDINAYVYLKPDKFLLSFEKSLLKLIERRPEKNRYIFEFVMTIHKTALQYDQELPNEKIHLGAFYNYITSMDQSKLSELLSKYQISRDIFFRLGHKVMCIVLMHCLQEKIIQLSDVIGLEADGEYYTRDRNRIPLAQYYNRHYGFVSTINPLPAFYDRYIPMTTTIDEVLRHC